MFFRNTEILIKERFSKRILISANVSSESPLSERNVKWIKNRSKIHFTFLSLIKGLRSKRWHVHQLLTFSTCIARHAWAMDQKVFYSKFCSTADKNSTQNRKLRLYSWFAINPLGSRKTKPRFWRPCWRMSTNMAAVTWRANDLLKTNDTFDYLK